MTGATVADRRIHPATVPLRALKEAPSTILGIPAAYAVISDRGFGEILLVVAAMALAAIAYQYLAWRRFRYGIGADEIVIESGILSRTRRSIPFGRIQDVDIERGPLQRLFGLAKLRIETGGAGRDEGVLDSVSVGEAERLQTALRLARSDSNMAAVGSPAPPERTFLFAMSIPRTLLSGIFNFSLVYLAGLFAVLQWADDWLPFDPYNASRWIGLAERYGGRWSPAAILSLALVALLLGVLTGIARTLARDYNFRLSLEPAGFRRERGLFTRTEVLIPKRRVQLALLESGPLRRRLDYHRLLFQTLGGGGAGESGRQAVAPLARAAEIAPILSAQDGLEAAAPAELKRVSSRHVLRRLILAGALPLAAILAAALLFTPILFALALLPFPVAAAFLSRRFHRYGVRGGVLHVQSGVLRRRQWLIPLDRVQSLRLRRTWLQRRLGLATLSIDTAGGSALDPPRIVDLDEASAGSLAEALLDQATVTKSVWSSEVPAASRANSKAAAPPAPSTS